MAALLRLVINGLIAALAAAGVLSTVHAQPGDASIATDKPQYLAGETITICYSVPGPGPIAITDYSSDGTSALLAAFDDDGTGWCFVATAQGPASTERLVLTWASGNDSGEVETGYRVVEQGGIPVPTLQCTVRPLRFGPSAVRWQVDCDLADAAPDDSGFAVTIASANGRSLCDIVLRDGGGRCSGVVTTDDGPVDKLRFYARLAPSGVVISDQTPTFNPEPVGGPAGV